METTTLTYRRVPGKPNKRKRVEVEGRANSDKEDDGEEGAEPEAETCTAGEREDSARQRETRVSVRARTRLPTLGRDRRLTSPDTRTRQWKR
jgi:hypothetical protein